MQVYELMGLKDDVKLILFFQIGDHGIDVFDFFMCFLLFFLCPPA